MILIIDLIFTLSRIFCEFFLFFCEFVLFFIHLIDSFLACHYYPCIFSELYAVWIEDLDFSHPEEGADPAKGKVYYLFLAQVDSCKDLVCLFF